MTREKAIAILMNSNEYHHAKGDLPHSALSIEAFNMAIEALKNQPQEETFEWCHDCKEYDQKSHCCHRWTKVIRDTVDELEKDRRPRGEWKKNKATFWICSTCGFVNTHNRIEYNYCPNCGADMRKEPEA